MVVQATTTRLQPFVAQEGKSRKSSKDFPLRLLHRVAAAAAGGAALSDRPRSPLFGGLAPRPGGRPEQQGDMEIATRRLGQPVETGVVWCVWDLTPSLRGQLAASQWQQLSPLRLPSDILHLYISSVR